MTSELILVPEKYRGKEAVVLLVILFLAAWTIFVLVDFFFGRPYLSKVYWTIAGVTFGVAFVGVLTWDYLRYSGTRELMANGEGIVYRKGTQSPRKLTWQEIVTVRHGPVARREEKFQPLRMSHELVIEGRSPRKKVRVSDWRFSTLGDESLESFARSAAEMASAHAIPVTGRDSESGNR